MSCDHELANEWARYSGKNVSYISKTFVAGWRKLLRKVERRSTLSNKFWLCCSFFIKLTTCRDKSTNQRAAFLQPATNVFVAGQVDQARWKTGNIDENLQRNNLARQVDGFCISYFAALKTLYTASVLQFSILKSLFLQYGPPASSMTYVSVSASYVSLRKCFIKLTIR